jgi:predicted XRE-type DNA-binding protein
VTRKKYVRRGQVMMKKHGYVEGTGNVYADLGVANPQEARAKADLAHRIVDIIEARKLTQVQAGKVLGVDQPKVSALKRGRLTDFSIERLVGFLLLLGQDVQITVTPKPHSSRKPPTLEVNAMGAVAAARR